LEKFKKILSKSFILVYSIYYQIFMYIQVTAID